MHRHKANTTATYAWTQCVAAGACSGKAHGGVTHVETCSCGAERRVEANGTARVAGRWHMPTCPACGRTHPADQTCPVKRLNERQFRDLTTHYPTL